MIELVAEEKAKKLFTAEQFYVFHKMFRQCDVAEDVNIDIIIYDILSGELYLPYKYRESTRLSREDRANYLIAWFKSYTSVEVYKVFEKALLEFNIGGN